MLQKSLGKYEVAYIAGKKYLVSSIIQRNLDDGKILLSDSLDINFFNEAKIVYAIFGFCDIWNFTDVTEILREEVLVFVNTIAEIVHSEAINSMGGANKNIGDAFLLVWKLKGIK